MNAQTIWQDVGESSITPSNERYIIPASYKTYAIDLVAIVNLLNNAPKEFSVDILSGGLLINLPMPDGNMRKFSVVESSLMPNTLAAKFPNIKSYVGQGIDDKTRFMD